MGTSLLVGRDLEDGEQLLAALEQEGLPIVAAFWRYPSASSDGRLVIATPLVDQEGSLPVYQRLQATLDRLPGLRLPLSEIVVVGEQDPVVRRLRQSVAAGGPGEHFSTSLAFVSATPYAPYLSEQDTGVSLYVYRLAPSPKPPPDGAAVP